jgi:ABC-2 type transport system ATP-binding protein
VLDEVSFDLRPGIVTGLLGPSGSGKTTLMRAVVGVQARVRGTLLVLDQPAGSPGLRTRVAYVTQSPSIYADLTVVENLRYFAHVLRQPAEVVDRTIATVGLEPEANKVVRDLSGGQRSRVSLATALLGGPDLLVLDEPTVGLDPVLRRDLWDHFHRLAGEGVTLLVSSHVMDEAERCDRLLLLHEGRLLADTTVEELRARTGVQQLDGAFIRLIEESRP